MAVTVVADPDRRINERHRENNTATRDFILQNRDFYVTERYFSPDGDSIKDSTELAFRLQEPADVDVLVVDAKIASGSDLPANSFRRLVRDVRNGTGWIAWDAWFLTALTDSALSTQRQPCSRRSIRRGRYQPFVFVQGIAHALRTFRNLTCDLPQVKDFSFANDEETAFPDRP